MRRHGKGKAHVHATGIALDGRVNEFLHFSKVHDLIELAINLFAAHAENRAIEVDVLTPSQFRVKASAHFQQTGDAAFDLDFAGGRCSNTRENLEKCTLAGSITSDNAEHFALLDGKRNIPQSP